MCHVLTSLPLSSDFSFSNLSKPLELIRSLLQNIGEAVPHIDLIHRSGEWGPKIPDVTHV